jgi:GDPmannose 4,6-dehydratase
MQWMMLQQEQAEDFVIATGVQYSVRQFVDQAALELGIEISWSGEGVDEVGTVKSVNNAEVKIQVGAKIVAVDERYFRPAEVETLLGDPTKAKEKLGWTPKISFEELVSEMVREDFKSAKRDSLVKQAGYQAFDYHE